MNPLFKCPKEKGFDDLHSCGGFSDESSGIRDVVKIGAVNPETKTRFITIPVYHRRSDSSSLPNTSGYVGLGRTLKVIEIHADMSDWVHQTSHGRTINADGSSNHTVSFHEEGPNTPRRFHLISGLRDATRHGPPVWDDGTYNKEADFDIYTPQILYKAPDSSTGCFGLSVGSKLKSLWRGRNRRTSSRAVDTATSPSSPVTDVTTEMKRWAEKRHSTSGNMSTCSTLAASAISEKYKSDD